MIRQSQDVASKVAFQVKFTFNRRPDLFTATFKYIDWYLYFVRENFNQNFYDLES